MLQRRAYGLRDGEYLRLKILICMLPPLYPYADYPHDSTKRTLAGGQTLIPTIKYRLARPGALIGVGGIAELLRVEVSATSLRVGAMVTHATVADSGEVKSQLPGLARLAASIGGPHVRYRGTIGCVGRHSRQICNRLDCRSARPLWHSRFQTPKSRSSPLVVGGRLTRP